MKKVILTIILLLSVAASFSQVGIGTTTPDTNAALDVSSTTKGLLVPRMTYAQRNAIVSPAKGLTVFCTDCAIKGELQVYTNNGWYGGNDIDASNTAVITNIDCNNGSTGDLFKGGIIIYGTVTQTLSCTVTKAGTYYLSATANGVTFRGYGTVNVGIQTVILTAIGTATATGLSVPFVINGSPTCTFNRPIFDASTNGTGGVSSYTCSGAAVGTMKNGIAVSGVTQVITANVTTLGTYDLVASNNGVDFAASGTFTTLGSQSITLTATGTPSASGTAVAFPLNTVPTCSFNRPITEPSTNGSGVVTSYNCTVASAGTLKKGVAVTGVTQTISANVTTLGTYNITSTTANGVTFAGSGTFAAVGTQNIVLTATGTPIVTSGTTFTLNTTPGCAFTRSIVDPSTNGTGIVTTYNCTGTAVGTMEKATAVSGVTQTITATVSTVGTYAISAVANGVTFTGSGTFAGTGSQVITLTATGTPSASGASVAFALDTNPTCSFNRVINDPSTNGTGVVTSYTCGGASVGTMEKATIVSGVTQTITANVTTLGTYNLSILVSGVTFAGSGTFTVTGTQNLVLTATGTPTASGAAIAFPLNTTPTCSFNRVINDPSTNGTGVVTAYNCTGTAGGTMERLTAVSGVTQTITATVSTVGTYAISILVSGVTFTGSGTFAGTGSQVITLTASGTPTISGAAIAFPLNTTPTCSFTRIINDPSTNGTGIVTAYNCTGTAVGTMEKATAVSGVTQTITATVSTVGTYAISAVANGVTFTGSGTFAGTGSQVITLTATGTPSASGAVVAFPLNTTPTCSFNRIINDPSTNGTGIVTAYNCTGTAVGTIVLGDPVSGVTQTITATVSLAGTYNISILANGITFTGTGTFAGTGVRSIELTASGTSDTLGDIVYTLNTTPNCSFTRTTINYGSAICDGSQPTTVVEITSITGQIWMDRNLGAGHAALSSDDYGAYGCLYQWGRGNDGHASVIWTSSTSGYGVTGTTSIIATSDTPGNLFITNVNSPQNWRNPNNDSLWSTSGATNNNPCPTNFRVPTSIELQAEKNAYSITNRATAFTNGPFRFATSGYRSVNDGSLLGTNVYAYLGSSTGQNVSTAAAFYISSTSASIVSAIRGTGVNVRCIKG